MASPDFEKIFQNIYFVKLQAWQEMKMRFKFVRSLETQDNKKSEHLKVNSYGPRSYFKLEVKEDCRAILSLHQEDEDEMGVAKTRPNTDLGMMLMRKDQGMFKLLEYVEPRKQREVIWETALSAGDYYLLPKSFARNVMGRRGFLGLGKIASEAEMFNDLLAQKTFTIHKEDERATSLGEHDYNERSVFIRSVVEDVFRKLDKDMTGSLSEHEIAKVRRFLLPEGRDVPFAAILSNFELKLVTGKAPTGLTLQGFSAFFRDMIRRNWNVTQILEMFESLGYDSQLFSFKSRVALFKLYSTKKVIVKSKDALKGTRLLSRGSGETGPANRRQHRQQDQPAADQEARGRVQGLPVLAPRVQGPARFEDLPQPNDRVLDRDRQEQGRPAEDGRAHV